MLPPNVWAAREFALKQHEGQKRKHGLDYVFHPDDVAGLLAFRYGVENEDVLIAALLHDVIEECGVAADEIAERFGRPVADMVTALSRAKGRPYSEYAKRLSEEKTPVLLIKGADMVSNLRDSAFADEKTRRSVARHARECILPLVRERHGDNHVLVRDLELLTEAVERLCAPH
jgi:(p)ppGpp synthase/HD superfamily hydrolase